MRLLSLDLDRYGPFTGRHLAFRPEAHLHVVLGPNEAGKSSALAAVTDLFFGTKDTRYEFLHRQDGLQLGAEIAARDGRTLAFRRRRGTARKSLTDLSDAPLGDDALLPFLGGLTRAVFCNAFGLDAASLRHGAEEMLKSDGEIGATLFAAASGLRGFRDAAQALDEQAEALFTPMARKRRLNELIRTYEEARSAARTERVGTEAWRTLEAGLAAAATRLGTIAERRRAIAEENGRLKRLKAAAPILAILDGLVADLQGFAGLPDLDPVGIADLREAARRVREAAEQLAATETRLRRAEADLAAIPADDVVLPWLEAIEALVPKSGEHRKDAQDLPGVLRAADGFDAALKAVATRLGLAGADEVVERQPSEVARTELKALLSAGRDMEAERLRAERELDRLRGDVAALRKGTHEGGALADPAPLRLAHEGLRPVLAELGRRDMLRSELGRLSTELDRARVRLRPALGVALEHAAAHLPAVELIRHHGEGIATAARERDRLCEQIGAISAEIAEVAARQAARQALAAVPDRAALAGLRQERDAAWVAVRAALFGDPAAPSGSALLQQAAAFECATTAADTMADRLIDDAKRAADQAADARRAETLAEDLARRSSQHDDAAQRCAEAAGAWQSLWDPICAAPGGAAEMAQWRSQVAALLEQADALASHQAALDAVVERTERIRPPLEALASDLGLAGLRGMDLVLIDDRVTERLRQAAKAWDAARQTAVRLEAVEDSVAAEEARLAALAARREAWAVRWAAATAACVLPADTGLEGASAALDAWAEVPGLIRERDDRRRRVAGMRRDMAAHEAELRHIAGSVGAEEDRPPTELVRALAERARKARETSAARAQQQRNRDEAHALRVAAGDAARLAEDALAALKSRLGLTAVDDLPTLLSRLDTRAALLGRIATIREELARAAEGVLEAELRAGLVDTQADAIEGRLSELASEAETLDHDGRVAHSERDRLAAEKARMEQGTGSEAAVARKGAAEVEIRDTARRYVVLKLGSLLLGSAIERHRVGQQDPLVQRAALLFRDLTGNVYQGLEQTFDERDQPILAGRRADRNQPVAVGGMSEGTRDQLFLALRLAYLEDYAGRAEPSPFLGDDIFASFDDRRTEHGLQALGAIGGSVQPILFTHHESVARAAERCLGPDADIVAL